MSDALREERDLAFTPRVIEVEVPDGRLPFSVAPPQVIVTDRAEPVVPKERAVVAVVPEPVRRRNRAVTFGIAGVAIFLAGWGAVDAVAWISAAFERGVVLGALATAVVAAGVAGAGAVIAHELASLLRLKSVEVVRRRFTAAGLPPRS